MDIEKYVFGLLQEITELKGTIGDMKQKIIMIEMKQED